MTLKFGKKLFALCLTDIRSIESSALATYLAQNIKDRGDLLYTFNQPFSEESFDVFRLINFEETDGVIIETKTFKTNNGAVEYIVSEAKKHNTPVITIDGKKDGCASVIYDYGTAFEELVEHLITKHGCRKIDMIAGTENNSFSDSRIEAYKSVLEKHGIPFRKDRVVYGEFWHDPSVLAMEKLLEDSAELPDAVVCVNDASAIAACEVLNSHGYFVPEDILVTGFDGIEDARLHYPQITNAQQDIKACANVVVKMLYSMCDGAPAEDITIPFALNFSQSCGCQKPTDYDRNAALRTLSDKIGAGNGFDQYMIEFGNSLIAAENLQDASAVIGEHSFMQSVICMNKSFADFSKDFTYDADKPFEDEILILCHKGVENEFFNDTHTSLKDLMPVNTQNPVVYNTCYVFNAIRFGQMTLGYAALPVFVDWKYLYWFFDKYIATLAQAAYQFHMREHMKYLYCRDPMTGLYNRRGFFESMKNTIFNYSDGKHYLNIYSFDMNDLKYINDNFGHADGDFAIKTISQAMLFAANGKECYNARFGGDEFVSALVTADAPDNGEFADIFRKELKRLSDNSGKQYSVVSSCGFSTAMITSDLDIDGIIRSSDVLMYQDKAQHKRGKQRDV